MESADYLRLRLLRLEKVRKEPVLEDPGHLVSPARVRPSRSHRLKMKNPPTGTKYFCQL